jgi:carbonic anhydrase
MPHITIDDLLARNVNFANSPNHVPQPFTAEQQADSAHTIVVCCFDPRAFPEQFFEITPRSREIVSIRNAGGHSAYCP